ncbi:glycosyltransferase family 4 protein [Flavobacterium capsici]|uniref:Glycosyltransferase family 4 protein n=1 Tax=Flavobacterium capsici TaxID=3075618 RepID=A0AA96F292_9FLAO|nr:MULTISPECIES: glycosyltransferase family 4 protein [unclassified Flavobacterium]WNM20263.1 glycosyltransferase family 4 protein [Flavobacterium sp. PMR2A8]WNM21653.1 glycosyltransferase family 4 protein [Flavobacterium sp. PMTSA4]
MKIAFLTSEFPHPKIGSSGGIGTSIYNLSKGLIQLGHEVSILIYGQNEDDFFVENAISYYRIKNVKLKGFSRLLTQKKIQNLINRLFEEKKIDLIEAPDWTGISSNIKPNCPVVIRLNGSDTYFCHLEKRPVKFINKYRERKALQNANGLISVSKFTADITNNLFSLNRNFTIIPNSIDVEKFSNVSFSDRNENTILYFGTLIRKKGLLELPLIFNEIYKINNQVKLILIGRDASDVISGNKSTWKMMEDLFDENAKKNVDYLGSKDYSEIKEYICESTICVFPTFAEALPVSWIEAMALEKAIVASDIGWANEVINDGVEGFLVNPKDHLQYAQKVMQLIHDKNLRTQFGVEARKKVIKKFSIEVVAKQSFEFYQKVVK